MRASVKLTNLVKMLCAQYRVEWWCEQSCLRLVMPDVEHYLQIENVGKERISIGLYYDFEGRHMPEMEIVLWSGFQPEPFDPDEDYPWAAIEYTSIYDCWKLYVEMDSNGQVVSCFDPAGQSKLSLMANDWSAELERQDWLGENVWLSRCAKAFDSQAIWERDLERDYSIGLDDLSVIDWLIMPVNDEDEWSEQESGSGEHYATDLDVEEVDLSLGLIVNNEELAYG